MRSEEINFDKNIIRLIIHITLTEYQVTAATCIQQVYLFLTNLPAYNFIYSARFQFFSVEMLITTCIINGGAK